jgi:acyl carrier protein
MSEKELLEKIRSIVTDMLLRKGHAPAEFDAQAELLGRESGIDSLDLALLVRELQRVTGRDPFRNGFVPFRDAAELARLYM